MNETTVVTTGPDGTPIERKAVDPNFRVGHDYEIPEIGEGAWRVTEVEETGTRFVGGASVTTTRVTVVPGDPDAVQAPASRSESIGRPGERFTPSPFSKSSPKPTRRERRQPK
ncbi:hypothetical protein EON77_09960 [bacterium]|nr:MAG: hypothetical protein EON77_09960 [bacterium]